MMAWRGSREASIRAEIERLEGVIERLEALRSELASANVAFPGRDEWTLRGNCRNEESRRSGVLAIAQSIVAAEQQLAFLRQG